MKKYFGVVVGLIVILGLLAYQSLAQADGKSASYDLTSVQVDCQSLQVNGSFSGEGTLSFENGDSYEGTFLNVFFDGQGTFISHEGWQYQGAFTQGVANGQGQLTTALGKVFSGNFKDGELVADE